MNFLAHIFLSGPDEKLMVGNFIGDFVKGNQLTQYEEPVRNGILLHREIDRFTDTHRVVLESKKRLRPEFGHYAPVIVDIFYDHFLARDFAKFSEQPLEDVVDTFYARIATYHDTLPAEVLHMLKYMKRDNWLWNYRLVEGIHRALSGLARRTSFESGMERATGSLTLHYDLYSQEFHTFFPELVAHANGFRNELTANA